MGGETVEAEALNVDRIYWHLKAANNQKRADSGEGYHNKEDCRADALAVRSEPRVAVAIYDMLDEDEEEA
jgi:hypothetical protein